MNNFGKFFYNFLQGGSQSNYDKVDKKIDDVPAIQAHTDPFALGVFQTKETQKRTRKQLYTLYKVMGKDPTLSACLSLLTTAALGGHEAKGDVVFIQPADSLMSDNKNAKQLRYQIEQEAKILEPLLNNIVFAMCRMAIQYGDSYVRVYGEKGFGVTNLLCGELTESPFVQAYEQGGRTVGYHILEKDQHERLRLTRLTNYQMVRMKIQRISPVPQHRNHFINQGRLLASNDVNELPVIASEVGGSFLQDAEDAWQKAMLNMAALNSQQIADSISQNFLQVNMSSMTEEARNDYKRGLSALIDKSRENIESALNGGEALYMPQYFLLPTWDDKQVLTPMGDVSQRTSPLNTEYLMLHLRRMTGALGVDIALTGWADMLAGGLGDGASFHTNAQIMQKSIFIRQAATKTINEIIRLHFGYKLGKVFKGNDLPWKVTFYSDISAAAQESVENKNTRAATLMSVAQAISGLKEVGLDKDSNYFLLTDILGIDDIQAQKISETLAKAPTEGQAQMDEPDSQDEPNTDDDNLNDDSLDDDNLDDEEYE